MSTPAKPISIAPRTLSVTVQDYMNASVGQQYWIGQDIVWKNFLQARNTFIREQLEREGLSPKQFKDLSAVQKRYRTSQLDRVFAAEFFEHTRDGGWMQDAVGNNKSWIYIHGMSAWHVKSALHALVNSSGGSPADSTATPTESASSSQPADTVSAAATDVDQ
ncbi:uncharacterized protein BP5553_01150 [Venustampulla echinocandica]|uniref:Uncharacterized protein n=1 Tax=Venustampulla echinocandica TaxID=2656787 RepID=A0A370U071_9HELO|nr:uncharacterized protein BP5553_01150 [Venustampulla echinocandica]RDL41171.1 hypothetical protein BP5553_01150 [Venustampulla echinocandica]